VYERVVPGPIYDIPSSWSTGEVKEDGRDMSRASREHQKVLEQALGKEQVRALKTNRTVWLNPQARHIHPGPSYNPKFSLVEKSLPSYRIAKGKRWSNNQYVTKEMLRARLLRDSPGPKYMPGDMNKVKPKQPCYSFGAREHRPGASKKNGYLSDVMHNSGSNLGPAAYDVREINKMFGNHRGGSARAVMGNTPRFSSKMAFPSKRARNRAYRGKFSPGPKYYPLVDTIEYRTKVHQRSIPASGAYKVDEGSHQRTTLAIPRRENRSSWIHGHNVRAKVGGMRRLVIDKNESPGPGSYDIPSSCFVQYKQQVGCKPPLSARQSTDDAKGRGMTIRAAQTARAAIKVRPPSGRRGFAFTSKSREMRLEKQKAKLLAEVISAGDSSSLSKTTSDALGKAAHTQSTLNDRIEKQKALLQQGKQTTKQQNTLSKKKEVKKINNPFKSREKIVRDAKTYDYRELSSK
jgi:hypothetical protein